MRRATGRKSPPRFSPPGPPPRPPQTRGSPRASTRNLLAPEPHACTESPRASTKNPLVPDSHACTECCCQHIGVLAVGSPVANPKPSYGSRPEPMSPLHGPANNQPSRGELGMARSTPFFFPVDDHHLGLEDAAAGRLDICPGCLSMAQRLHVQSNGGSCPLRVREGKTCSSKRRN